jgi:hypothetical protein
MCSSRRHAPRFAVLLGVLAAVLALPGVAGAQAPAQDSVVGSGEIPRPFAFDIDARSGPSGENPTGTAGLRLAGFPALAVQGPVTCLTVSGNRAVIGIANTLGTAFVAAFLEVTDGTTDSLGFLILDQVPTICPATVSSQVPLQFGSIVVTDAQPLPISKDQCKNGGWRTFGDTFKNQGQCVAFVQHGPKPTRG